MIKFILAVIMIITGLMTSGYVGMMLWEWFIVPVFDAPPLRVIEVMGLILIINFIQRTSDPLTNTDKRDHFDKLVEKFTYYMVYSGVVFCLGIVYTLFM